MKNKFLLGLIAIALIGCGSEEPQKAAEAPKAAEAAPPPSVIPQPVQQTAKVEPSCGDAEAIFMCTIKNKPLTMCQEIMSDFRVVSLEANVDGKEISASANDSEAKSPIKIQSVYDHPITYDTAYFEDRGDTYAITRCNGMCVQPPWLTIYTGGKKSLVAQCDEESSTDNFYKQYKTNKKGKIIKDGLYQEKSTKLNFDGPYVTQ
jgi:hypothetical protein